MQKPSPDLFPAIPRYALAFLASAAALILTRLVAPKIPYNTFDLFQGAVVASACYGGLGPGLVTAVISIFLLDYFFIPPLHTLSLGVPDFLRLCVFGAVAFLTSSLSARLKDAKSEVEKARDGLELRVEQRTEELKKSNAELEAEITHRLAAEKEILQISSREQRRLGEDLHDGLCQNLAGIRLLSQELKDIFAAENIPHAAEMARIENNLGEALTQADILARGLYPVELETNGLMAALQEMATKMTALYRFQCRFKCAQPVLITDSATANHLYRIAQEAVNNAVKRGKAKRVSIRLLEHRGSVRLTVTDDGLGLTGQPPRPGMGLKMMAYRARMINGNFQIRSRRKGVTRVVCSFKPETSAEEPHGS